MRKISKYSEIFLSLISETCKISEYQERREISIALLVELYVKEFLSIIGRIRCLSE